MTTNTNAAPTAAVTAPDEREAFEKYMAGSNLNRTPFDDYENNYVHGKWSAWQARAALAATPAAPTALSRACDLLSTTIGVLMGQREKIGYTDNSPIASVVKEAVEFLRPWPETLPAAAPVVLPEPGINTANHAGVRVVGFTEQQVRSMLAQATAAPAAVAGPPDETAQVGPADSDTTTREAYRRMFIAACDDLGLINEALGLDPNDGGAEPILTAIEELKAATPAAPAAQGDALDAERLDYIGKYRVALIPEFEGGWDAQVYEEDEEPCVIAGGMTVRGAIDAARAAKGE